jgi:hypothetical protein
MQALKHTVLVLAAAGALAAPAGALGATSAPTRTAAIPPQYVRVLAAAFSRLPQGEAQLLISAIAKAPFSTQNAIVAQVARLSPTSVQTMNAVLATAFQGMSFAQARSFADTLVGVGTPGEEQLVAATASAVLTRSAAPLPSPFQQVVVTVFRRVTPAVQLVALAANRLEISQSDPAYIRWYIGALNYLIGLMEPTYDVYAQSLVAVAVGLDTPADDQRYRELLAYLQSQIELNNLYSGLAAEIHASNQYQGERWACLLGPSGVDCR